VTPEKRLSSPARIGIVCSLLAASAASGYAFASRSAQPPPETSSDDANALPRGTEVDAESTFTLPRRVSGTAPADVTPPALPEQLRVVPEVTAELEHHVGHEGRQFRTVTRTAEVVHVRLGREPDAREWLFVRNPVDPRRISAALVNHQERAILEYDDTALRRTGIARGWAEVVSMGVELEWLRDGQAGARARTLDGVRFHERSVDPSSLVSELWWSDELALPLRLRVGRPDAESVIALRALRHSVDRSLLVDPRVRFPTYNVVDSVDWLEKLHDHGPKHHAHASVSAKGHTAQLAGAHRH
jgi:hypothetical protein